jgi:hypothetical protein
MLPNSYILSKMVLTLPSFHPVYAILVHALQMICKYLKHQQYSVLEYLPVFLIKLCQHFKKINVLHIEDLGKQYAFYMWRVSHKFCPSLEAPYMLLLKGIEGFKFNA